LCVKNKAKHAIKLQIVKNGSATKSMLKEMRMWLNGSNQPMPYALKASRNKCVSISIPMSSIHPLNDTCRKCFHLFTSKARIGVAIKRKRKEWENPLCANKLAGGSIQKPVIKSPSGTDCAMAPTMSAGFPIFLPTIASAMHAPSVKCVMVSIDSKLKAKRLPFTNRNSAMKNFSIP